jgi:hypothetical protein
MFVRQDLQVSLTTVLQGARQSVWKGLGLLTSVKNLVCIVCFSSIVSQDIPLPSLSSLFPGTPEVPSSTRMVNTRNKSYSEILGEQLVVPVETLTERRIRCANLLRRHHYQPVIDEVLDEELPKYGVSSIINTHDRISHTRECALILASAPLVFAAAVDGSLVRDLLHNTDLQKNYVTIQAQAHSQPSIYIHLLADEYGIAPTPNQYMSIRSMIQEYLAEGPACKHAFEIDNITSPKVSLISSTQGHRKYLQTKTHSSKRIETLHRFCAGIQNRYLETPPSLRDTPFQFPPGECGYSKDSHARLAQHRAHNSSNYVMNLVEDICTYLHRSKQFSQHFRMHQFIIYLIFRPSQAAIAEIFCSGLLQVWVENGGGFNAYPAGRSVATARRVSEGEWASHERWVRQMSPVDENMRVQRERAEEWRRALVWDGSVVVGSGTVEDRAEDGGDEDMYDCV